jgi:hypothetical protein
MKRKLAILVAAVLLALVLAIPASASQRMSFSATGTDMVEPEVIGFKSVGNRCFLAVAGETKFEGELMNGTGPYVHQTLIKGDCSTAPDPGTFAETFHDDKWFTGELLGREGTMYGSCQGQFYLDEPKRWEAHCVVHGVSGELVGMHGTMEWRGLLSEIGTRSYWGEVHFDPQ